MYRVTQILRIIHDSDLEEFKQTVGVKYFEKIMENAAERGKLFHGITEYLENNFKNKENIRVFLRAVKYKNPHIYPQVEMYKNWLEQNVEDVLYTERDLADPRIDLGGRPDLCVKLKDKKKPYIIDKKFTAKIFKKNHLQLAAYVELHHAIWKERPGRIIMHFTKEGKMNVIHLTGQQKDYTLFMCAYNLYKYYYGGTQ